MAPSSRFDEVAASKQREAANARIARLSTILEQGRDSVPFIGIGNAWTRARYGGDFDIAVVPQGQTALSLVFVQSRDGNTVIRNPAALGGGDTDRHLIYEGLSRVAADAVLAGAATVHRDSFFSVWHPELIALRQSLGLPRHPAQIVLSERGHFDVEAPLFNVPDVPVFLVAADKAVTQRQAWLAARPWVRHIRLTGGDLRQAIDLLRDAHGVRRISVVGGRHTASRLVDAGLTQDLYLTTTSRDAGEPGTSWYIGDTPPLLELVTRKQWFDEGQPVQFEHLSVISPTSQPR